MRGALVEDSNTAAPPMTSVWQKETRTPDKGHIEHHTWTVAMYGSLVSSIVRIFPCVKGSSSFVQVCS